MEEEQTIQEQKDNNVPNTTHKSTDRATRTPLNAGAPEGYPAPIFHNILKSNTNIAW